MVTTGARAPGATTFGQRWLARLAFVATLAAMLVPPLSAGVRQSLALTLVALAGLLLTAAAVWWVLAYRGLIRSLAAAVAVAAPLGLLVLYSSHQLVWFVVLSFVLLALAAAAGRA